MDSANDVRPIHQACMPGNGRVEITTHNRIMLLSRNEYDDPRVQLWLKPWYGDQCIPICDIDSFIGTLQEYRDQRIIQPAPVVIAPYHEPIDGPGTMFMSPEDLDHTGIHAFPPLADTSVPQGEMDPWPEDLAQAILKEGE